MPTQGGSTAASSAYNGWKAYATYSVDRTDPSRVVVTISEFGMTVVSQNRWFNVPSSGTTTVTVNGSSRSDSAAYYDLFIHPDTGRMRMALCTTRPDYGTATRRTWTFTYSRGHAEQTKSISFSAKFNSGWTIYYNDGTTEKADKSIANTTSSGSFSVSVPALDSYAIALDNAGGTGATSATKYYGEPLALPQPVKDCYAFAGWADESDPSTVVYQPGDSYTDNSGASLVAVWEPAITSATVTRVYAARDDGSFTWDSQTGTHTSASDDGEYVYIRTWWRVDGADAATISLGASMADTSTVWTGATRQVSKPGTGELYIEGVAEWGTTQTALVTGQYDVTVTLSTGAGNPSDTRGATVSTAFFTIDVLAGGHGIAFGKPATRQLFDVGMETNFDHDVRVMGTPLVPVGTILDFAAATAPSGYLVCDGSAVSRTTYAALFAVIGTTWGTGDGSTTFNVPDFRGRTSIGAGTGTGGNATAHALGSKGGDEALQSHSHSLSNTDYKIMAIKNESGVAGSFNLQGHSSGGNRYALASTNSGNLTYYTATASEGAGNSGNMQPFATVTKIIRAI